jgi:hypothetical protein
MPLKDVAAAGGWRDTATLLKSYQQVDDETLVRVVAGGAEALRRGRRAGAIPSPQISPHRAQGESGRCRQYLTHLGVTKRAREDSNPQPSDPKSDALSS